MRIISKSLAESLFKCSSTNPRLIASTTKNPVFRRAYCDSPDDKKALAAAAQAKLASLLGNLRSTKEQKSSPDREINLSKPAPKRGPQRSKATGKPLKETHKTLDADIVKATKDVANILKDPKKREETESDLLKKLKSVATQAKTAKHDDKIAGEPEEPRSISELFQDLNIKKPEQVERNLDDNAPLGREERPFRREERPFGREERSFGREERPRQDRREMTLEQVAFLEKRSRMRREASKQKMEDHIPVNIFGGEPLGVFLEPMASHEDADGMLTMWRACAERELRVLSTPAPRNALEEMIVWTEQGKLWHFPILNEQGVDCSDDPFHKHVFLEHNLEPWCPTSGPVRHFMELVCVGLSKNPYITSDKKVETIVWFKDYFERPESIDILNDLGAWEFESEN